MYVDVLDQNNYLQINLSLIKVLGLKGAAYATELFSIVKKAATKDKMFGDDAIRINRTYIESRIQVTTEEQYTFDTAWSNLNLVAINNKDKDIIAVNVPGFIELISGKSLSAADFESVKNSIDNKKAKKKSQAKEKETKKARIIENLCNHIKVSDETLLEKLQNWVSTLISVDKLLNVQIVEQFVSDLLTYAGNDITVACKIVHIATCQGWNNCDWAISSYEKNKKNTGVRTTPQQKATKKDIEGGVEF